MAERQASYDKKVFHFKKPAGTSRGILTEKTSYFIRIADKGKGIAGTGECSLIPGLSPDAVPEIEKIIEGSVQQYNAGGSTVISDKYPALRFAWETALLDLENGGKGIVFPSDFTEGSRAIEINGLVWMSSPAEMLTQADEKVKAGFRCIKMKIGALDFAAELEILSEIRGKHGYDIELRLDANGAFHPGEAIKKLERLSEFGIHSIEQPIKQGLWEDIAFLSRNSPVAIALDEELIGVHGSNRAELLDVIKPQFIILKPSLIGGLKAADEWIALAEERNAGWWATSALESNVGLGAIAQWVGAKDITLPQGLGTGGLFVSNTEARTEIRNGFLYFKA